MVSKSDILYEKNKYNRLKKLIDDLNGELNKLIKSADYSLDGKTDTAIKKGLNISKKSLNNLRESIYSLEVQLSKLADTLDKEQKRIEADAELKLEG